MSQELESTLDPIQRPIALPVREAIYEDGTGFDQLQEYTQNASEDRILKQSRADFITTGLISADKREKELKEIEVEANEIMTKVFDERNKSIRNMTLQEILTNTSDACIAIVTELFNKPEESPWAEYVPVVFTKDNRYVYVGIVLVILSIWVYLMRV